MKTLLTTVLLMGSLTLLAQSPELESLIADFERGKQLSLAYIDAMPEDYFDYRPAEGSRSYAEQFLHLAQGTIGLSANGSGTENPYGQQNLEKEASFQTKSEVRRLVEESYDFAIAGIQGMDPGNLTEIVSRGPFNVTRIGWVQKAKEHADHHRGQAAVYLRLKEIVPPQYKLF
jgi:uncharacterized damage-inducible protein DinB